MTISLSQQSGTTEKLEPDDTERLDWIEARFHGTGETVSIGGACYWGIDVTRGRYGMPKRIGEGGDLREAIDDAMEAENA